MRNIYLISFLFLLFACKEKSIYKNSRISKIDSFEMTVERKGEKLEFTSMGVSGCYIADTFLLIRHSKLPYYLSVYGISSLNRLDTFLMYGRGPDEFMDVTYRGQYKTDSTHDLQIYVSDINQRKLCAFHVSESLKKDTAIITTIANFRTPYFSTFIMNDSTFLSNIHNYEDGEISFACHDKTGGIMREYLLFDHVMSEEFNELNAATRINPDLTKVVMGMLMYDQINILDLEKEQNITVTASSHLMKRTEGLRQEEPVVYYSALACTGNQIYALYTNQKITQWQKTPQKTEIHVISWQGKPICKLIVPEYLNTICIDENKKQLYGLTFEEELYRYDIKDIVNLN